MSKTGNIIKQARLLRKLTQSQLAASIARLTRCGYTRAALSQVEKGETKNMKPANLFAACKELGIDPQACIAGKLKWLSDEPSDVQDEPLPLSCAVTSEQISQKEQDLIGSYRRLNESQQHDILQRVEEIIADYKVGKK